MSACVEWAAGRYSTGYGRTHVNSTGYGHGNGRDVLARRAAWEDEFGPIPEGMQVHHLCENRLCVNVEHMELLDVRHHAGALGHGKLTQTQADEIRALRRAGHRGIDVAPLFGVSVQQVCNIVKGRCWA